MTRVVVYHSPFNPADRTIAAARPSTTLRDLTRELAHAAEWPTPTVALVDGAPWLRARWDEAIGAAHLVEFRTVPRGTGGLSKLGAAAIASISMQFTATMYGLSVLGGMANGFGVGIPQGYIDFAAYIGTFGLISPVEIPGVPSYMGNDTASPTYSIAYRSNRKRLGEPIPVLYGRHRLLPDLIAQSYGWFDADGDQYTAAVLCLGHGEFDVDLSTLKFGEAPFSELTDILYEVVPPGQPLTLFPDRVTTSAAVAGQTIQGPAANADIQGAPIVTFSTFNDGSWHARLVASEDIFGIVTAGNSVIIAGTTNYNGTRTVQTKVSDSEIIVSIGGTQATETPRDAIVSKASPTTALIVLPPALTFTAVDQRITSATGAGAFAGVKLGDSIAISNTVSNNGTFAVLAIAEDLSWVQMQAPIVDETATNGWLTINGGGWSGWFEAATPSDTVESLAVDLVAGRGIGTLKDDGGLSSRTIRVTIEYQGLDAVGVPQGVAQTRTVTLTGAQQKAYRRTDQWTNDTGWPRVRCRARRTNSPSTSTKALDDIVWAALKAYLPNVTTYPGVTILAVQAKATEQLSAQQSGQVSVVATRKVPTWNGAAWTSPTATRSIAWALADALRSSAYGAGLTDAEIDLPALRALDILWAERGDAFDGVFDQKLSTWEALTKIARAGRAQPVLAGGQVTVVRDGPRTVRAAMFTPSTILPGSLSIDYRLPQDGDPDGTSVAWMDPAMWQQSHIDHAEGGGTPLDPQDVDLFGVTDVAQATREVVYLDRVRKYLRKSVRFTVEMDGHLVNVGDLVAVSHDVPAWGQSGDLVAIEGTTYTASEPLTWTPAATHSVLLRRPDGSVAGPYAVAEVPGNAFAFTLADALDFTPRTDRTQGDRTGFQFGPNAAYTQDIVVVSISPQDANRVDIQGVPYDARVHAAGA